MCGRYALIDGQRVFLTFDKLKQLHQMGKVFEILPRYNASPMQKMPVIAVRNGDLVAQLMQWWLIPSWSKDGKIAFSTFNAKAETLEKSRLFFPYFKGARCLVPADAFYEWKKHTVTAEVRGKKKETTEKQPMCIRMKDDESFMFAGLFSVWKNEKGEEFPTYTIITTEPNELMSAIHTRMPVILDEKHFDTWLDRDFKDTAALKKLLAPYPKSKMRAYAVSRLVSNSRNDVPECLEPEKKR